MTTLFDLYDIEKEIAFNLIGTSDEIQQGVFDTHRHQLKQHYISNDVEPGYADKAAVRSVYRIIDSIDGAPVA